MNKHLHRIVFNRARGVFMAVAEIAGSHGKAASGEGGNAAPGIVSEDSAALRPTTFVLWAAWGLLALVLPTTATAQIVADPSAPANQRPTIVGAGNGVPVVNIQTPSAAGVSRNAYTQFDVQQQGAILNNARTSAQTQLGGWIAANPMLAGGTARVILNEVNSSNPSLLRGYVEVGGDRAQVVIANPAGVTCDGCGFINANRATLTTGTPILNGGNLEGYRVQQGTVTIQGEGLKAESADYTDIIARAVQVNAAIWTQDLRISSGANQVNADNSTSTPISGLGAAPAFGIDVAALGGMYAGKITLVGTEAGVGVRNAGKLGASAGNISISNDGFLLNSGDISAAASTHLSVTDTLTNRGYIGGEQTLLQADTVNNLGTGMISGNTLAIAANTLNNLEEGGTAPALLGQTRIDLGVTTLNNQDNALIFSAGDIAIGGALDSSRRATGQAGSVTNASATIEALGNIDIAAQQITNSNLHFSVNHGVALSSTAYDEYAGSGYVNRYASGSPQIGWTSQDIATYLITPEGTHYNWLHYLYTRTVTEDQVQSSVPAKLLAGGDMQISADTFLNDKSQVIAGGQLTANIGTLSNIAVSGQHVETDSGTLIAAVRGTYCAKKKLGICVDTDFKTDYHYSAYAPAPAVTALTLAAAPFTGQQAPAGTGTSLPNNTLFHTNPESANGYLIETDPRFADYRNWLSSDYLLNALSYDPINVQKRLGDGFYEQKLIREQVAQLTGRRFLDGYADDEAQYAALMNNGATYAQAQSLRPGVALSAAQVAALTSDIVWLVEKSVTLPDGSTQTALVPQIYLRPQAGDLQPSGALIAADSLNLNISGDLKNSGSVAGRNVLALTAENINNLGGRISAKAVDIVAQQDLNNIGGTITAEASLRAIAGNDLSVVSTTSTQTSAQGRRTNVDRVAGLYVTGDNGTLVAAAGNDLNLMAAAISNAPANGGSGGSTVLVAGNNLNLGTVAESSSNHIVWDDKNQRKDSSRVEIGTTIQTQGNIALQAGNDLTARAASVTTSDGALTAMAGRDILLTAGENQITVDESHQHKSKGLFSSKTITTRDTLDQTVSQGTLLSGNTVAIGADRDITVKGSQVVSTGGTMLIAQRDISIEAATDTTNETHLRDEKKSGLMSSGGLGVTLGSRQLTTDTDSARTTASASTVGSIAGNVQLLAGQNYRQVGSDVIAPQGDIDIAAQKVDIVEARETSRTVQETKFKQSGLTLAITSPVISAIQTAQQMSQAASDTKDDRMKLLAAANTGFAAKNAYDAVQNGQGITTPDGKTNQVATGKTLADGSPEYRDATAADQVGGINISLSIGSSQSSSKTTQTSDSAAGSTVAAGRNVTITASGAGHDSDITVQGSNIKAGNNATLIAEDELKLLAAKNSSEQHSTNKNSSASVGISFGTNGLMFNAGVSGGKGKADGSDVAWTNTHVDAGNALILQSGGDTTLKGAVATGKQVIADVGGNLNIESLQDTSKYDSKQQSFGVSVSVGMGAMSGSVSASKSTINSDYASVTEQSGIKAGDGGFQINVQGNTDLKGAVIASTEKAIQDNKNSFQTASLSMSDIQNSAHYDAKSVGVNIGSGVSFDGSLKPSGTGVGFGKDGGNASSTTQSGISGIAGNKDVRTGDAETGIQRIFDADLVQKEIAAQQQITQKFNELAPRAAASHAVSQVADLKRRAEIEADPERKSELLAEAAKWAPNGSYNIAMNLIIGAAGGTLESAVAKETLSWAASEMRQAVIEDSKKFKGLCVTENDCISNQSGKSVGVNGDNFKAAGGRIVLADWCAAGRCEKDETSVSGYKENSDGTVKFNPGLDAEGKPMTIDQFVAQNENWRSPLGGHQGGLGLMDILGISFNYEKGSFWDKLAESYAGTHDTLNSSIWYDKQGNGKALGGTPIGVIGNITNMTNVVVATPFALSVLLPPEVWSVMHSLMKLK